ncbi:hypothetical protein ABZ490_11780 [Streptomyces sp. NPDC005811]|uniref:SCO0607 family lipoprotein n=1 Tax=Streptomyces sp. NPDC005811 TaxID=3154565 RepID=UPI003401B6C0
MSSKSTARRRVRRGLGLALVAATAAGLLSACSLSFQDAMCSDGEYPALAVNSSGGQCVKDGQEPPEGWVRYPEGKVPEHVGDQWDEYWTTHTVDENGKIVPLPPGQ